MHIHWFLRVTITDFRKEHRFINVYLNENGKIEKLKVSEALYFTDRIKNNTWGKKLEFDWATFLITAIYRDIGILPKLLEFLPTASLLLIFICKVNALVQN